MDKECPWIYLSARGNDGLGGQILSRIGLMAFAKARGFRYCHPSFNHIHHVRDAERELEKFINLSSAASLLFGDFTECAMFGDFTLPMKSYDIDLDPILRAKEFEIPCVVGTPTLVSCRRTPICGAIFSTSPDQVQPILPIIRNAFTSMKTSPKSRSFNLNYQNVAIHKRRGDAPSIRTTTNVEVLYAMRKLREIYGNSLHFRIYTEGPKKGLNLLRGKENVTLHVSEETKRSGTKGYLFNRRNLEDLKFTFEKLVSADILVVSNSAFSYAAALYSTGTVFYFHRGKGSFSGCCIEGFTRKPLSSWIPLYIEN